MTLWSRVGLQARLGLALIAVAVISVALATLLSSRGLERRLDQFASDRLQTAAVHSAGLASGFYENNGGWTRSLGEQLTHLAEMNGYRLSLTDADDGPIAGATDLPRPRASSDVVVAGRRVGEVSVAPLSGEVLTGDDRALRARLDHLHLLAGGLALLLGLLVAAVFAPALARPLRRLTAAARRMEGGDLQTRVDPAGAPELRDLGHALNRLAETLEQEEHVRRDAAADIAHEVRTPLAAIVSRIEAARDGVLPDEEANLGAMHTEALRLTRLVEDLGRLAEAQQPGLTLRKERIDLRQVVQERTEAYRGFLEAKGIHLDERLEPAEVHGDRGRVIQIVDNLLSNALRYTDSGGTVAVELRQRDGEAVLDVTDTGIGIRGEDLPYVFERFWRGERSRARSTGGAGIGLAIVRELVRAHDGRIDVRSRPGEGSSFHVVLPVGPPSA
jgi:signal transduction histidine kinase